MKLVPGGFYERWKDCGCGLLLLRQRRLLCGWICAGRSMSLCSSRKYLLTYKNIKQNLWFGPPCRSLRRFCFIWTTFTTFPTWEATRPPAGPICPPTRRSEGLASRRACWWWKTWSMTLPWRWDAPQTRSGVIMVLKWSSGRTFLCLIVKCSAGQRGQHVQRPVSHSLQVRVQPGEPASLLGALQAEERLQRPAPGRRPVQPAEPLEEEGRRPHSHQVRHRLRRELLKPGPWGSVHIASLWIHVNYQNIFRVSVGVFVRPARWSTFIKTVLFWWLMAGRRWVRGSTPRCSRYWTQPDVAGF